MFVQLHPKDGADIVINRNICVVSGLLKTALENDDEERPIISLDCDRKSLLKAVEYMQKIHTISPTKDLDIIPSISWSTQFSYNLINYPTEELKSWGVKFITSYEKLEDLSYLVYAANYLDIPSLLSLSVAYIMHTLRNVDFIIHSEILDWNLDRKTIENFPKTSVSTVWYNNKIFPVETKMKKILSNEDIEKVNIVKNLFRRKTTLNNNPLSLIVLNNGYFIAVEGIHFQNNDALYLFTNSPEYLDDYESESSTLTQVFSAGNYTISLSQKTYTNNVIISRGSIYPKGTKKLPSVPIGKSIRWLSKHGQEIIENDVNIHHINDDTYSQRLKKLFPNPSFRQRLLNNFFNASKIFPADIIPMCFKYDIPSGPEYACICKYIFTVEVSESEERPFIRYGPMFIYEGVFNEKDTSHDELCYINMSTLSNRNWFHIKRERERDDEMEYEVQRYFQYSHYLGALTAGEILNEEKEENEYGNERNFLTIWDLDSKTPLKAIYEEAVYKSYVGTYEDKIILVGNNMLFVVSPSGETKPIRKTENEYLRVVGKYIIITDMDNNALKGIYNISTNSFFEPKKELRNFCFFNGNSDTFVLVPITQDNNLEIISHQRYLFNNGELKELDTTPHEGELLGDTNHDNYQIYAAHGEVHLFNLKDFTDTLIWNFGKHKISVIQFISKTRFAIFINSLNLCYTYDITMKSFRKFNLVDELSESANKPVDSDNDEYIIRPYHSYYAKIIGTLGNSSFFYRFDNELYFYSDQMTQRLHVKGGKYVNKIIEDENTHQLIVIQGLYAEPSIEIWA